MCVGVVEARDNALPAGIQEPGPAADAGAHLGVRPDRDKTLAGDGHGLGLGLARDTGPDACVHDGQVRHGVPPSASGQSTVATAGMAGWTPAMGSSGLAGSMIRNAFQRPPRKRA